MNYRDYSDPEKRDHDLNRNLVNRVFDLNFNRPTLTQTCIPTWPQGTHRSSPVEATSPMTAQQFRTQVAPMSDSFLKMKHAQETETLMENPTVNQLSIRDLRQAQDNEIQQLTRQRQMCHVPKV